MCVESYTTVVVVVVVLVLVIKVKYTAILLFQTCIFCYLCGAYHLHSTEKIQLKNKKRILASKGLAINIQCRFRFDSVSQNINLFGYISIIMYSVMLYNGYYIL